MGQEDRYSDEREGEYTDFVPAVFARSAEEAEKYRELLDEHDIPAIIGTTEHDDEESPPHPSRGFSRGVPVLVPESLLDEAGEVIAENEDSDEFVIDEGFDDEDDDEDEEEEEGFELTEEIDPEAGQAEVEEPEEDVFSSDDADDDEEEDDDEDEGDKP